MTNIMAWVKNHAYSIDNVVGQLRLPGADFNPESIFDAGIGVALSDGLAGGRDGETSAGHQKLFQIGNNYLLGTGNGRQIVYTMKEVDGYGSLTPKELGNEVLDVIKTRLTSMGGVPEFIMTGHNNSKLEVYSLTNDIMDPVLSEGGLAINGCGSTFVDRALKRDISQNHLKDTRLNTLADMTSTIYDWGNEAARSSGVNDEFQFGFMTKLGNAMVVHPNISGNFTQIPLEYRGVGGEVDQEKMRYNDDFFIALVNQLGQIYNTQNRCNRLNSLLTSELPVSRELMMADFETVSGRLNALRWELNHMVMNYVKKHNPNGLIDNEEATSKVIIIP
jgi:hypothetical protein